MDAKMMDVMKWGLQRELSRTALRRGGTYAISTSNN